MVIFHFLLKLILKTCIRATAHLRSNTCHSRPAKAIENNVTGLRVMQNISHNRLVRYLRMIAVRIVNRVILAFTDVGGKRLTMIVVRRLIIRRTVLLDKIRDERIRAGGVVRRAGERNDVLVLRNREAFYAAHTVDIFFCEFSLFHRLCLPRLVFEFRLHDESRLLFVMTHHVALDERGHFLFELCRCHRTP